MNNTPFLKYLFLIIINTSLFFSCSTFKTSSVQIGNGWAKNSVNTVIFRQNAITTYKNYQFTAYYDNQSKMVLAKRKLGEDIWEKNQTQYSGNTSDAHNAISIAVDGAGYLHVSWDHHDNELRYAKSKEPLGLALSKKKSMTNKLENKVSYPQFYNLKDGNLLFLYRSGHSGSGSLVANYYNTKTQNWDRLQENLIDGEGKRNAYWQTTVDTKGTIHISWVWRESWDVATNHDIAYARSKDGGKTWEKSTGEKYILPITAETAEYAWKIPQKSSLINQTSMTTDEKGNPYIASYWNEKGNSATQLQVVYNNEGVWKKENTNFRTTSFNLGGGGTKSIPISRPEILVRPDNNSPTPTVYLLYRDKERDNKISLVYKNFSENQLPRGKPTRYSTEKPLEFRGKPRSIKPFGGANKKWKVKDITKSSVGQWEPNFDKELLETEGKLHIFVQKVKQIDGEGVSEEDSTPICVIEVNKLPKY